MVRNCSLAVQDLSNLKEVEIGQVHQTAPGIRCSLQPCKSTDLEGTNNRTVCVSDLVKSLSRAPASQRQTRTVALNGGRQSGASRRASHSGQLFAGRPGGTKNRFRTRSAAAIRDEESDSGAEAGFRPENRLQNHGPPPGTAACAERGALRASGARRTAAPDKPPCAAKRLPREILATLAPSPTGAARRDVCAADRRACAHGHRHVCI